MFRTYTICHLLWSKPVQKFLIYDRIGSKKENVFTTFFLVGRGKYYGYYSMVGLEDLK